jgi:hypothetical protein
MSNTENGTRVTITYESDGHVSERTFDGVGEPEVAAAVAAIVGRRLHTEHRNADWEQQQATRKRQMRWYADRMIEALYDGWWFRWLPSGIRRRTIQGLVDYLKDVVDSWTDEMVVLHSEVERARRSSAGVRPRSAAENGPRLLCTQCPSSVLLGAPMPEGWTEDAEGRPHCPEHPAAAPAKGQVA